MSVRRTFHKFRHCYRRTFPPLPRLVSPRQMLGWIRARKRRRRAAYACLLIGIIGLGLWLGGPRAMRVVKCWQARRLAAEARTQMDQQEWNAAMKSVQSAFRLRSTEPQVWRALARLLSRTGRGAQAMEWWQKIEETGPLTLDDRRDFATAAIAANELTRATQQLETIRAANPQPSAADLLLAGQLAAGRGLNTEALGHAEKALAQSPPASDDHLKAAIILYQVTRADSPQHKEATARLLDLGRDSTNPKSLAALTFLGRQADAATAPASSLGRPAAAAAGLIPWPELADLLEKHPKAQSYHRILALKARALHEPAKTDEFIARAIELGRQGDDEALAALCDWLLNRQRNEQVLAILPLERAALRRELLLQRIDALGALGRFEELKEMLMTELSAIDRSMQHMFLAVTRARLGEATAAENEWSRAMEYADTTDKLLVLANYAEKNRVFDVADAANVRALGQQPKLYAAYAARLHLAEITGRTPDAYDIAREMAQLWPDDTATKIRALYLRLLIDQSIPAAKEVEEEASAFLAQYPDDFATLTTLALARLRQGRIAAALEAAPQPGPGVPASPVLAAAWAVNGWKEKAEQEVEKLRLMRLLPEERSLVARALNK